MSILKDLVHVSYCSHAQFPVEQAVLDLILKASQRNNQRDDITGLLTYSGEVFVQFIEGPPDAIRRLMGRLQSDPRHRDIIILSQGSDHERIFPDWDMELVTRQEAYQVLRDALSEANSYDKVIGLSSLLSKLDPNMKRST
jgi:hypothetical protein